MVRVPRGGCASHPLLSPHDIRHQPECVLPQHPSPCHSSAGEIKNKVIKRATGRNKDAEYACRQFTVTYRVVCEILGRILEAWSKVNGNLG